MQKLVLRALLLCLFCFPATASLPDTADLDAVLLPHPLLGKLTVREMLFFTVYHVQHHRALVERDHAD